MAFALSLDIPGRPDGDMTYSRALFSTTLITAFLTVNSFTPLADDLQVLLMGGATIPLLSYLKIPIGVEPEDEENRNPGLALRFDRKYLKPFFTNVPYGRYRVSRRSPDTEIEMEDVPIGLQAQSEAQGGGSEEGMQSISLDE